VRKEIVHNSYVVTDLAKKGAIFVNELDEVPEGARVIYSAHGVSPAVRERAKERGLKICVDVFITPVAHRIIAEERRRFPDWEGNAAPCDERLETRILEILALADFLLCPGENVVDGLRQLDHEAPKKVRVVPYGSGADFGGRLNIPVAGRVLFAGTAELRKGIHYFAAAAKQLPTRGYDFRVAGGVTDRIRQLPACRSLNFLGRISRTEMVQELLRADVVVLPTLAEGSASVISEALVAGVPVITTHSAGSVVVHGNSGLLVPERDAGGLAIAIENVISDRARRASLASGARATAPLLSEEEWGERLLAALKSSSVASTTAQNSNRAVAGNAE